MGELGAHQPLDKAALEERIKTCFPKKPLAFFSTSD
jgi:hypothetical protein